MNRLYQVETQFSLTGGMADHRLRVAPSRVGVVAAAIAAELGAGGQDASDEDKMAFFPEADNAAELFKEWVKACADDLNAAGAGALVLAGSRQTKAVKQLAAAMNKALASSAVQSVKTDFGAIRHSRRSHRQA